MHFAQPVPWLFDSPPHNGIQWVFRTCCLIWLNYSTSGGYLEWACWAMFERFGMEPCSGSFGSTIICSLSPTWDDYPIWLPYRDGNPATGLWTCPGAQEGLRQKRLAGYRQGALLENHGKTSCCKGFKRETWETLTMKHGELGISMGKNDGNNHTPWITMGYLGDFRRTRMMTEPLKLVAVSFVHWVPCWVNQPNPWCGTLLDYRTRLGSLGFISCWECLPCLPSDGFPSGLRVMGPGFATIPGRKFFSLTAWRLTES